MACPTSRGTSNRSKESSLVDLAIGLLIDHCLAPGRDAGGWRFGPVVLVSPAPDAASVAVRSALAARSVDAAAGMAVWDGRSLDREIAAAIASDRLDRLAASLDARRLVVVDRIDRVTAVERQQALVHLLDSAAAGGTAWCVSVAVQPPTGLLSQCASRLGGGLVVPVPAAPARAPAATVSLGRVIRAAARHHDLPAESILGPARNRTVAAARSLAMYLARTLTDKSFHAIGAACGHRDHSTVIHGVRVCAGRIARDPTFAAEVARLAAELTRASSPPARAPLRRRATVGSTALTRALENRRRGRLRPA